MNELDKKIREALRKEDADLVEDFDKEPSIFAMVMETFRGRHRGFNILALIVSLVFLVLGVLSAIKFFDAQENRDMLMWAGASIICLSVVSMLKVWFWMEIHHNGMLREIKRLELQIAHLAGKIKD